MPVSRRPSVLLAQLIPDRNGSPQHVVLEELRRVVLSGGAPPGTPIPVGDVAKLFGVSAIPVREALKTLMGEGLVGHRPNQGYAVAQLTRGELREIYLVRGVLESTALRAAVGVATDQDVAHARAAHEALDLAVAHHDASGYHRESRRFHLALMIPCRMQRLLHMFESAWNITEPLQPMNLVPDEERARLHGDHEAMLDAFAARDVAGLIETSALHHRRLESAIAELEDQPGLLADAE